MVADSERRESEADMVTLPFSTIFILYTIFILMPIKTITINYSYLFIEDEQVWRTGLVDVDSAFKSVLWYQYL